MKKRNILKLFLLFSVFFNGIAVNAQELSSASFEICDTDITHVINFKGSAASAFGIKLGMHIKEAKEAAKSFSTFSVVFEQDRYNNNRFYIYELGPRKNRKTLAYLLWPHRDSGLKEIILFQDARDCIPGGNKLFSHEGLDSGSALFNTFFGKYSKTFVELDIESIHLKNTRYYYPALSLILVECIKGDEIKYQIVFYDPSKE